MSSYEALLDGTSKHTTFDGDDDDQENDRAARGREEHGPRSDAIALHRLSGDHKRRYAGSRISTKTASSSSPGKHGREHRKSAEDPYDSEDEDEVLGLMGMHAMSTDGEDGNEESKRPRTSQDPPLFRDDDLDTDSARTIVHKVVPESDDPTLPTLTPRVFILGTLLCLFFFKSNAPSFSSFFIILIAFPLGHALTRVLPESLNTGPFNKKEHLLIGVLAASGASAAYAGEIISVQDLYYKTDLGTFGGLLLLLSTQLIGFGLSGLTYRLLVRPTVMLWPSTLVLVTLFETLHGGARESLKQTRDRMRFFTYSFVGIFSWQFLPALIFPTLTSIAVLCLINNSSLVLRTLGSGYDGFGLLDLSLDWSVIGGTAALYTPWFAQASYFAGFAINMWVVTPVLYFTNWWDARSYDSPLAAHLYNSTYGRLDVIDLLNPDLSLNEERFSQVGPIRLTPYFALSYGISFAVLTSAVSTVILWHWKDITAAFGRRDQAGDIHVEMLERSYSPIPNAYYTGVFCSMLAAAAILVTFYPLQLPIWGLLLSILMAGLFLIPVGVIAAITNTTLGLNVITEFVAGYLFPGRPIANIVFKVYGYMTLVQSIDLTSDMKLGLYCKIPPRHLFICQVYGTALGSIVNYSLIRGVIDSKRPYLDGTLIDPTGQWSGRKPEIFMSASVIWGLVGPARFFAGLYRPLYLGFAIGAVLPFLPWFIYKRTGNRFWRRLSVPLVLHGSIGPPQLPTNVIIPGFLVGFASQFWAFRYKPKWFEKYNYVLSSALDAGTSINALVIYLFSMTFPTWWGNSSIDTEHCLVNS
ncbi:hypothetical protein OIV83_003594 [Microbotryomycetes sp. JL201]|nr:hypothetical protein OIV83_003594 [Microbotryomycetes sp. JL201]